MYSLHQVDIKSIVKCWKDFLWYFATLETYRDQDTAVAAESTGQIFCLLFNQESQLKQLALTANYQSLLILKKDLLEEIFVVGSSQCLLVSAVAFLINGKA